MKETTDNFQDLSQYEISKDRGNFQDTLIFFVRTYNGYVEIITLLKHSVERDLADFWSHGGLGQLSDGILSILNTIGGLQHQKHNQLREYFRARKDQSNKSDGDSGGSNLTNDFRYRTVWKT